MLESAVLLGALGVHSIEDIRDKKITVTITLFFGIIGVILHLLLGRQGMNEMLFGALSGTVVLAAGRLLKGGIGTGDGIVFMLTGLYLGAERNVTLMVLSFFLAGIYGFYRMLIKGDAKNREMPFIPFLFLGYCIMLIG